MKFNQPLVHGTLIRRYKRFLADVELSTGEIVLAHVPNSGSMKGVSDSGSPCRLSISNNPSRKIPYTLEMVRTREETWVGVNTSLTNKLVHEAFLQRKIPRWEKFEGMQREVKINSKSRLDFCLTRLEFKKYVEVKNVSMALPPWAVFPDAETERGQKHLVELETLVDQGHEAEIFFVVQREDCEKFRPCDEIDPKYGELLRRALKNKVQAQCWSCRITEDEITLNQPLTLEF